MAPIHIYSKASTSKPQHTCESTKFGPPRNMPSSLIKTAKDKMQLSRKVGRLNSFLKIASRNSVPPAIASPTNLHENGASTIPKHPKPCPAKILEKQYRKKRAEIVSEDGFIITPLHVLKCLVEQQKTQIHTDIFKFSTENSTGDIIWRVEIYVDELHGVGQSLKRSLSQQLAAADLLNKIRVHHPNYPLPAYGILPGMCIRASIHKDLEKFCMKINLPKPCFQTLYGETDMYQSKYTVQCTVGSNQINGRSDVLTFASRIAAKFMLESISGKKYPNENDLKGSADYVEQLEKLILNLPISKGKQEWIERQYSKATSENESNYVEEIKEVESDDEYDEIEEWFDAESDI